MSETKKEKRKENVVLMCIFSYFDKCFSTDYAQEQEMEIEALQAILMDEFEEIDASDSGLNTSNRCFQITLSPQDDDADEPTTTPVQLALIFSHTEKYPDEPPLLNVKSLRGIQSDQLITLKQKLEQEASENLGMAMVYTLITSAKEWLDETFCQDAGIEDADGEDAAKDDIVIPHGEPVTLETFVAWRERFEAELALERAKLMPESALTAPKEKKLTGRQWFESVSAAAKGATQIAEGSEDEDEEDIDFDDEDFEVDEEDMLKHYLEESSDSSSHAQRAN
ncbi:RWD domain [Macleaya cordata]|uniref:RWD domain n=1 Tax=Macleaya cordata TaxID=56857 RepID=A0A200QMU1_MACCD|nr:RWD domain [Macleaya cordata]